MYPLCSEIQRIENGQRPIASSTTPPSRMPPDSRTIPTRSPAGVIRANAPGASYQANTRSTGAAMRVRRTNCRVFMRTSSLTRPALGLTRKDAGEMLKAAQTTTLWNKRPAACVV